MPFGWNQPAPNDTAGQATWDVPANKWLGLKFEQGIHDTAGNAISRWTEDVIWDDGNKISPQLATKVFGLDGKLTFSEPISIQRARLISSRKQEELTRQAYMDSASHSAFSAKAAAGLAVSIIGGMSHPVDFSTAFLTPIVGSAKEAELLRRAGATRLQQAFAKGVFQSEGTSISARAGVSFLDAAVGNAIAEIPVAIQNNRDMADYGILDSVANVVGGGVLAAGIHTAWSRAFRPALEKAGVVVRQMDPELKELAVRKAISDFARGEDVDVSKVVELDPLVIRGKAAALMQESSAARGISQEDVGKLLTSIEQIQKRIEEIKKQAVTTARPVGGIDETYLLAKDETDMAAVMIRNGNFEGGLSALAAGIEHTRNIPDLEGVHREIADVLVAHDLAYVSKASKRAVELRYQARKLLESGTAGNQSKAHAFNQEADGLERHARDLLLGSKQADQQVRRIYDQQVSRFIAEQRQKFVSEFETKAREAAGVSERLTELHARAQPNTEPHEPVDLLEPDKAQAGDLDAQTRDIQNDLLSRASTPEEREAIQKMIDDAMKEADDEAGVEGVIGDSIPCVAADVAKSIVKGQNG